MLEITADVLTYLGEWLREASAPEGACVRLILQQGGLELTVDEVRPGDTAFESEGAVLLVIDVQVAQLLDNQRLGIRDTAQGPQLALT